MNISTLISPTKYKFLAAILILFIIIMAAFSFTVARAHSWPSYCNHSDFSGSGWYVDYIGHYTYGGQHWHQYDHAYYDNNGTMTKQHTEVNSCPN